MSAKAPLLITPECGTQGCSVTGDQYTMVRCRGCNRWYCADHTATEDLVEVKHTHDANTGDITFYQGLCRSCHDARARLSH